MRTSVNEKQIIVLGVMAVALLFILAVSCEGRGGTYYHVPGFDTHKSKTHKPSGGSGFKWGGSTTRKR
jgi:hypothetical protein